MYWRATSNTGDYTKTSPTLVRNTQLSQHSGWRCQRRGAKGGTPSLQRVVSHERHSHQANTPDAVGVVDHYIPHAGAPSNGMSTWAVYLTSDAKTVVSFFAANLVAMRPKADSHAESLRKAARAHAPRELGRAMRHALAVILTPTLRYTTWLVFETGNFFFGDLARQDALREDGGSAYELADVNRKTPICDIEADMSHWLQHVFDKQARATTERAAAAAQHETVSMPVQMCGTCDPILLEPALGA
ncbi:hypothetical protein T492DRAFT_849584 [Pavlovales sp. CCMP2436]|nr:hypothetical protein T492DRAFT_849584 [Pavlovales sp. CCMP2436]